MKFIPFVLTFVLIFFQLSSRSQAAEISVFAASSLTEVLNEIAQRYQEKYPADQIRLHFAGSQTLAAQIEQGAPADLFIAANTAAMDRLAGKNLVRDPRPLLQNRLVLAVQPELGEQLKSIRDLGRRGLLLVIGNHQVPVGKYTRQLLANLAADPAYGTELVQDIEQNIVSEENMVKAIVAKLLLGEVDAGIVYQSDLAADAARKLAAIPLPKQHNPLATYPLAAITDSRVDGTTLIAFLFSLEAQQIFARQGFLPGKAP
jgi:molybdate transport system substrate-binding protein